MTIDYRGTTNATVLTRLIEAGEGPAYLRPSVITGNDHTITFGYGYTFVRSGSRYTHIVADLATLGIVLSQPQLDLLTDIAIEQRQQLAVRRARGTPKLDSNGQSNQPVRRRLAVPRYYPHASK